MYSTYKFNIVKLPVKRGRSEVIRVAETKKKSVYRLILSNTRNKPSKIIKYSKPFYWLCFILLDKFFSLCHSFGRKLTGSKVIRVFVCASTLQKWNSSKYQHFTHLVHVWHTLLYTYNFIKKMCAFFFYFIYLASTTLHTYSQKREKKLTTTNGNAENIEKKYCCLGALGGTNTAD